MVSFYSLLVILNYILISNTYNVLSWLFRTKGNPATSQCIHTGTDKMAHDLRVTIKSDFELLTCWLFSQNRFSCVLSQLGYLSEAGASQSVKTKLWKQKYFHYIILQAELSILLIQRDTSRSLALL